MAGDSLAATAEQLMRSRFTAFAFRSTDYLLSSWHKTTRPQRLELDPDQRCYRLDIIAIHRGGLLDNTGTVEFDAYFRAGGSADKLHEVSRFVREDGAWLYLDGSY